LLEHLVTFLKRGYADVLIFISYWGQWIKRGKKKICR